MLHNSGFSLIEVLVASCIFSFGLLEIATFQAKAKRIESSAYFRTLAVNQMKAITEHIHAYKMLDKLKTWNVENKQLLPNGEGNVQCGSRQCAIKLCWNDWFHAKDVFSKECLESTLVLH